MAKAAAKKSSQKANKLLGRFQDRIVGLKRLPAAQLVPADINPASHPKQQQSAVTEVLERFGWVDTVKAYPIADGKFKVFDGHLRRDIAETAKVPVLVCDLTEGEARELLLLFNELGKMSKTDVDAFRQLAHLAKSDISPLRSLIEGVGTKIGVDWGAVAAGKIAERASSDFESQVAAEVYPVEPGQVWLAKGKKATHRIVCGSSEDDATVEQCLAGAAPELMLADPPYGVNYNPEWRDKMPRSPNRRTKEVKNDDVSNWSTSLGHFGGTVIYWWCASAHLAEQINCLAQFRYQLRAVIIWKKNCPVIGRGNYHWQHETCLYAVRKGASAQWCGGRKQTTVWESNLIQATDDDVTDHTAQKPVELYTRPLNNHKFSQVFDPFLGSGTTAVAAEQLGKQCFGIEIHPPFVSIALARLAAMGCKVTQAT